MHVCVCDVCLCVCKVGGRGRGFLYSTYMGSFVASSSLISMPEEL